MEPQDLRGLEKLNIGTEREKDLLDRLAARMGCAFLSDLHFLKSAQRTELARVLEGIPAEGASLQDRNDALDYFTSQPPEDTAEKARAKLIACLSDNGTPTREK